MMTATARAKDDNDNDDGTQLSGSGASESSSDAEPAPTQWLATTRQKRSTAGNRMQALLAHHHDSDSELELLFAEEEDDEGFSDADGGGSDHVDMTSDSDSDSDSDDGGNEASGEHELEQQARDARRASHAKRRAHQAALPARFRKRVRIDATTPSSTAPPPSSTATSNMRSNRKKKKSERISWLPQPADFPTRASARDTTRASKEQLHLQMAEREARRLRQLALQEKKAARLEAERKPPMTQAQRLAEAAVVERRNAKSLNRWQEAEKLRDEERRAKLAALNNRTLKGPVITFWSGVRHWKDALGQHVTMVETKPKKKRDKAAKPKTADADDAQANGTSGTATAPPSPPASTAAPVKQPEQQQHQSSSSSLPSPPPPPPPQQQTSSSSSLHSSSGLAAPAPSPHPSTPLATARPSGFLAAPVLAPPPPPSLTAPPPAPSPPAKDSSTPPATVKSNVLVPPTTTPQPGDQPSYDEFRFQLIPLDATPPESTSPAPADDTPRTTARNAIIYQNFDAHALRDKSTQTQILFGRKMTRLSKPPAAATCAITNLPARYRDPTTGLPYRDAAAYAQIQRLRRGDYRWSRLLGAWVGSGSPAARGVPRRFTHPDLAHRTGAPPPPPPKVPADEAPAAAVPTRDDASSQKDAPGKDETAVPSTKDAPSKDDAAPSKHDAPSKADATTKDGGTPAGPSQSGAS